MSNQERKKKFAELDNMYEEAMHTQEIKINEITDLVQKLPEIEIYDYEKDISESKQEGNQVIENMANLYLGTTPEVLNHPYIKKKKEHDAINQADMLFLKKMAMRALIIQLKQMDMGDTSHRNFETFYTGLKEIRDIVKQSTSTQNLQETFYKQLKEDLGITAQPTVSMDGSNGSGTSNGNITDAKSLNDTIRKLMEKKKNESSENEE
jgi:hypothetical protein